jgi:hypothetical protein
MRTVRNLVLSSLVILALGACGGGDDTGDATTSPTATTGSSPAVATSGATSATPPLTAADASSGGEPVTSAPAAATATAAPTSSDTACPDSAAVSTAYGAEVELDEAAAMTGAIGLVFCPYTEVIGPGATNSFGQEAFPDDFSITLTDQNPVEPGESGDEVAGVGESATWSEASGELVVWTGERGVIVSMTYPPPGDHLATAIAVAQLAM